MFRDTTAEFIRNNTRHRELRYWGFTSDIYTPVEVVLMNASYKKKQKLLEQELLLVGMKAELRQKQDQTRSKLYKAGTIAAGVANTLLLKSLWER